MRVRRPASAILFASALVVASASGENAPPRSGREAAMRRPSPPRPCPEEMVSVRAFCVDRWEASMVDRKTGRRLSPFYPPDPTLLRRVRAVWETHRRETGTASARAMPLPDVPRWQLSHHFEPKAVSRRGSVPQGYLSRPLARRACRNAGKRLCTKDEWVTACRGARQRKFPYGRRFVRTMCNVYRYHHPAFILHGDSSVGHRDPRLNLVVAGARDPVLRLTGATASCASVWGDDRVYDMVGNLDEWIDEPGGTFVGGFYARATRRGCDARITSHAPSYYDYSTGVRCCRDAAGGRS